MVSLDLFYHNSHVLLILPNRHKKPLHFLLSLLNSLLDAGRFLMSLVTFPRPKTPFLLACPPSLDWVRLCWFMVFSHFNPRPSWISLSRRSIQHVPSWVPSLTSTMQNGRSSWCVLQSLSCLYILVWHLQWQRIFFVVFCFNLYKSRPQHETKLPLKALRVSPLTGTLFSCVSVRSHCIWIAICCKQLNWDLDEL